MCQVPAIWINEWGAEMAIGAFPVGSLFEGGETFPTEWESTIPVYSKHVATGSLQGNTRGLRGIPTSSHQNRNEWEELLCAKTIELILNYSDSESHAMERWVIQIWRGNESCEWIICTPFRSDWLSVSMIGWGREGSFSSILPHHIIFVHEQTIASTTTNNEPLGIMDNSLQLVSN